MRSLVIAALLFGAAASLSTSPDEPVLSQSLVDEINSISGNTWTASVKNGHAVTGANLAAITRLLGAKDINVPDSYPKRVFTEEELQMAIPAEFDAAKNWPKCKTISRIWDQAGCGSCWAVGAASAISDRLCTTGSDPRVQFVSARDVLSCCKSCGDGCKGGYPIAAWSYWVSNGLTTEACQPYPFAPCGHEGRSKYPPCKGQTYVTPKCEKECTASNNAANATSARIKGKSVYSVNGEEAYQRELMANGPFEVGFTVFEDFLGYKSGVYEHIGGRQLGGHAVRVVGWGTMRGVKYWKLANSWNSDWGMSGYFLFKRGSNDCGIERTGAAGLPQ